MNKKIKYIIQFVQWEVEAVSIKEAIQIVDCNLKLFPPEIGNIEPSDILSASKEQLEECGIPLYVS